MSMRSCAIEQIIPTCYFVVVTNSLLHMVTHLVLIVMSMTHTLHADTLLGEIISLPFFHKFTLKHTIIECMVCVCAVCVVCVHELCVCVSVCVCV